ncbi:sulfotransferase family 2 domain-containing protein [Ponticaulis sp.]|uniref:sulfotransferase family 2 domain-containing protein n=1 Tax=Ponticaulis sp. TaxID=2020902 RepID=UPI0026398D28|nr:sulfotransferase family 2 domain-containing protein [Ponticaulis sp.]MDF1680004.1 sulfotransferase family 2 domain-containing protein [Ponticaulis sp.]
MISTEKNFIFIHVPKTGGNSLQDALRPFADDDFVIAHASQDGVERFGLKNPTYAELKKHSTLADYASALGPELSKFQLFATTRNPFDKLVSYYFSPHRGEVKWDADQFAAVIKTVSPLEHYTELAAGAQPVQRMQFLRFEALEEDFQNMCAELGISASVLHHRNKSNSRPKRDYTAYFSPDLIDWVQKTHAYEIKIGGYDF